MNQYLNLEEDDPEEYEGRLVRLDGVDYKIGPWIGEGAECIVHSLVNQRSQLALHLVRFIKDAGRADERLKARRAATYRARGVE